MKKYNLFNEITIANKSQVIQAINKDEVFGINIKGEVVFAPFDIKEIFIFKDKITNKSKSVQDIFGKNYQVVEDGERLLIKAFSNWQALIAINTPNASYDDTTADGVGEFEDDDLEGIGWNATEFNISYRTLVEVLEEKCEGVILCIEQEEPYQFSGLGFLADDKEAYDVLLEYCQKHIKKLMSQDKDFAKENLDDAELEALEFFKID